VIPPADRAFVPAAEASPRVRQYSDDVSVGGLSPINRAFNLVPKRAEARHTDQLRDTFVDSGVAAALEAIDHQVLYGRRGTGKTHALRFLETVVASRGDIAVYADLRTLGSPEGLFAGDSAPSTERAARLLVDLLCFMTHSWARRWTTLSSSSTARS
jgi:hypothetical protein